MQENDAFIYAFLSCVICQKNYGIWQKRELFGT